MEDFFNVAGTLEPILVHYFLLCRGCCSGVTGGGWLARVAAIGSSSAESKPSKAASVGTAVDVVAPADGCLACC